MVLVDTGPGHSTYIIYDAPVNEKTKKIREIFDMDEETGYPRVYNWCNLAKLGKSFKPEDPFVKFAPRDPKKDYATKVFVGGCLVALPFMCHAINCFYERRNLLNKIYRPFVAAAALPFMGKYLLDLTYDRQAKRNGILVDYIRKHPERFGETYRPKFREVLYAFTPRR